MPSIETLISGSEKLTQIFGVWPSFHDAEVIDLQLWRGNVDPDKGKYVFPVITVKIHLWKMTKEVDAQGYLVLRNHTLTTIRFEGVDEVELKGFNHQNAIFGLVIEQREPMDEPPLFHVHFAPAYGLNGEFKCSGIDVVEAVSCTKDGNLVDTSVGR